MGDNFKKRKNYFTALLFLFNTIFIYAQDAGLMLHYTFKSQGSNTVQDDSGNGYNAELKNGASIKSIEGLKVLDLGSDNGYLDFTANTGELIDSLSDFTIATCIYIDESTDLSPYGNFIWNFGNSDNMASDGNGSMFFSARNTRYAISETHWIGEEEVSHNSYFTKGEWVHLAYTQNGTTGTIYINGKVAESGTITILPSALGETTHNYLGKSAYNKDVYLQNAVYADFRIYNKALNSSGLSSLVDTATKLSSIYMGAEMSNIIENIDLKSLDSVMSDIDLPIIDLRGASTSWNSSNESYITNTGKVTRPGIGEEPVNVILTITLTVDTLTRSKTFQATILPQFDNTTAVTLDLMNIELEGNIFNLRNNIKLTEQGSQGTEITWKSDHPEYLTSDGELIKLAPVGNGKQKVVLTATVSKGNVSGSKNYEVLIAEDEGFSAYLFTYFTGNLKSEEQIRFAVSSDGYNYQALNDNNPVIASDTISLTGGVRDPHIYRGPDNKFYMVVTDMVSANGWSSNRGIVLLKSENLIDWTHSTVHIPTAFPEQFSDVLRVWAPQSIYDEKQGKHMVYFSMLQPEGIDIIYYAYTNDDFTSLETVPKQLYYSPTNGSCIDGDIIMKDSTYHLFFKTEDSGKGIKKATSKILTEGYVLYDHFLDQNSNFVEGSGVFKLINSDTYILMYDVYSKGYYEFTESTDLTDFSVVDEDISMDFHPRHGTVMPITREEAERIVAKWGKNLDIQITGATNRNIKQINLDIDNLEQEVYIPVKYGTNLTSFDPELQATPGSVVSPAGETDFSSGPVFYEIKIDSGDSKTYKVTVSVDNNPVLEGYYADPEILYSNKTKKFHLYPTSDGFTSWSGTYFKSFSSTDLVQWEDDGIILDLETDVNWTSNNAWAPTIIERKINDEYKYFYYYTAGQKIGVAVSDAPDGPFIDIGSPLIENRPSGVSGGQQIDPDVFHDTVSDKYYLYWGNGYMACAELNDDMVSIDESTIVVMTPNSTYREGTEVFYRNGKYYFLWSENDTRSEDYRVRYATADSPTGPLDIPDSNLVIQKDASKGIYGTGHNSVIQIPDTNVWYIVYHRFNRPDGITLGDAAGYYREVCIDTLRFNEDGSIIQVKPTLQGISPIKEKQEPVTPSEPSSINSSKDNLIQIWPCPARNFVSIKLPNNVNPGSRLYIYDITGKKVMTVNQLTKLTFIDVSMLGPGVYFVGWDENQEQFSTGKIIITNR